jgi:branched-subunit amino acid ABC-type transport system permease component
MKTIDKETGALLLRIALLLLKTFTAGKTKTGLYLTAAGIAAARLYGIPVPELDLSGAPVPVEAVAVSGSLIVAIGVVHDMFKKVRESIRGIREELKPKI